MDEKVGIFKVLDVSNMNTHSHVILELMQLLLMKRGGEEIYVGPLGHNSCHLIDYFEVSLSTDY